MIEVKILGYHSAQRYAIRQKLVAVQRLFHGETPGLRLSISELRSWVEIEPYTPVLSAPSLVVNEKLVCVGRIPSREEIITWIREAVDVKPGIALT